MSYQNDPDPERIDTEIAEAINTQTPETLNALKHKFKLWAKQIEASQDVSRPPSSKPFQPKILKRVLEGCRKCWMGRN